MLPSYAGIEHGGEVPLVNYVSDLTRERARNIAGSGAGMERKKGTHGAGGHRPMPSIIKRTAQHYHKHTTSMYLIHYLQSGVILVIFAHNLVSPPVYWLTMAGITFSVLT